jgi:hypothetical protein
MGPRLPPPDPNESWPDPRPGGPIPAATAIFVHGSPSPETDRVADRLLDLRPGLLIVLAAG